jgi:hypothetical protein
MAEGTDRAGEHLACGIVRPLPVVEQQDQHALVAQGEQQRVEAVDDRPLQRVRIVAAARRARREERGERVEMLLPASRWDVGRSSALTSVLPLPQLLHLLEHLQEWLQGHGALGVLAEAAEHVGGARRDASLELFEQARFADASRADDIDDR